MNEKRVYEYIGYIIKISHKIKENYESHSKLHACLLDMFKIRTKTTKWDGIDYRSMHISYY